MAPSVYPALSFIVTYVPLPSHANTARRVISTMLQQTNVSVPPHSPLHVETTMNIPKTAMTGTTEVEMVAVQVVF